MEIFGDSASNKVTTRGSFDDILGHHINIMIDPIGLALLDNQTLVQNYVYSSHPSMKQNVMSEVRKKDVLVYSRLIWRQISRFNIIFR